MVKGDAVDDDQSKFYLYLNSHTQMVRDIAERERERKSVFMYVCGQTTPYREEDEHGIRIGKQTRGWETLGQ